MSDTPDGLLLVDKPGGLTSHDVVSAVRRLARTRKVGHAGTLDPMATGLLVLGIGKATRLLTYLVGADKTYTATIRLGQATTTDDAEGEVVEGSQLADVVLSHDDVEAHLGALRGDIQQVPATVSAIKVDGKRAYARARAGEEVTLAARPVTIHEFSITGLTHVPAPEGRTLTDVDVVVRCSSGTYIRSLARDLGASLGVGGHLTALRRLAVGEFDVADAVELPPRGEEPQANGETPAALGSPSFLPLGQALRAAFPIRIATEAEQRALSYGQQIEPNEVDGVVGVLGADGQALALVENRDGVGKPILVFAPA